VALKDLSSKIRLMMIFSKARHIMMRFWLEYKPCCPKRGSRLSDSKSIGGVAFLQYYGVRIRQLWRCRKQRPKTPKIQHPAKKNNKIKKSKLGARNRKPRFPFLQVSQLRSLLPGNILIRSAIPSPPLPPYSLQRRSQT
jgi:hypothetical protein